MGTMRNTIILLLHSSRRAKWDLSRKITHKKGTQKKCHGGGVGGKKKYDTLWQSSRGDSGTDERRENSPWVLNS